jgi:hypothetical protein
MIIFNIIEFFKKQWFSLLLILLFIATTLIYQNDRNKLVEESKKLEIEITKLNKKSYENSKIIDSLKNQDAKIVDRIKIIRKTEYEKIIVIDSMSITKLQHFFTDRYSDKK